MSPRLEQVVATTLGIAEAAVRDDLRYQSTAEWSSLRHAALMLALEQAYGTEITEELIPELTSIAAIREFVLRVETAAGAPEPGPAVRAASEPDPSAPVTIHRGLEEVYFDRTRTTSIDGRAGTLHHRGYSIGDLAEHAGYEEMVHLLAYGELPRPAQLAALDAELKAARPLPTPAHELIRLVRDAPPLEVLRTTVSALPAFEREASGKAPGTDEVRRQGLRLIARIPTILAAHHAAVRGRQPVAPSATLSHAANFLYLLRGEPPTELEARIFDQDMVLHADHGSNASAFAARVAASTQADLHAATTAAIATFAGPLHGGALAEIAAMLETIVRTGDAAGYVERRHRERQPVFGFGHRVYRTEDARARHLRAAAEALSRQGRDPGWLDAVEALRREMNAYSRHGVDVNVDLYTAVVYLLLGIPGDLFVAVFAASRMAGWLAQVLEQRQDNTLIRPRLYYVGPPTRPYVALAER